MYNLKVEANFSSAHSLRGYQGKCEDLHGHNWKVEVVVAQDKTDKLGMVMDFKCLKEILNSVLDKLDHKHLNNLPFFKKVNPTSENLAKYIYDCLKCQEPSIKSVTVWESENCAATYYE